MNEFSFSNVLDQGWQYAKQHGLLIAVFTLIIQLVSSGASALLTPANALNSYMAGLQHGYVNTEALAQAYSATPVTTLLSIVLDAFVAAMVLGIVNGAYSKPDFAACKLPLMTYVKYIGVTIILAVLVVVGFICFIIPGVILAIRLQYAGLCVLDDTECGIGEAFKRSWKMTSGHSLTLLGLVFAYIVMAVVGVLCLFVGVFFAAALINFCSTVAYTMLRDDRIDA